MRRNCSLFTAVLLLLALAGCGKGSPTAPRVFTDSLTLGKGYHGIDLTGETNAFTITRTQDKDIGPTIYWRAESHSKMLGVYVEITVDRLTDFGAETVYTSRYEMIGLDDYVAITSYYHMYGAGTFRAKVTIGSEKRLLGVREFFVQ